MLIVTLFFSNTASDSCLGNNCSHICVLSATHQDGYSCLCPAGLELDDNMTECKGRVFWGMYLWYKVDMHNYQSIIIATLYVFFYQLLWACCLWWALLSDEWILMEELTCSL